MTVHAELKVFQNALYAYSCREGLGSLKPCSHSQSPDLLNFNLHFAHMDECVKQSTWDVDIQVGENGDDLSDVK